MLVITLLGLMSTGCAELEQPGGKFRSGDEIIVPANETVQGDLYLSGGDITVNGPVNGDLFIAGSNVVVNGDVKGDLYAVGGQIELNGQVDGDVAAAGGDITLSRGRVSGDARLAGGTVSVLNTVAEDLLVGTGTLDVGQNARVGGDLIFGAGTAKVGGAVSGAIIGSADSYSRSGTVGGSERVNINETQGEEPAPTSAEAIFDRVRTLATLLLVGALIVWRAPGILDALSGRLRARPFHSLGWGLLGWVGIPVALLVFTLAWILLAIVVGVLTLGGLAATIITAGILANLAIVLALALTVSYVTWVIAGYTVARVSRTTDVTLRDKYLTMGLGALALILMGSLPVVDVIVGILVSLAGVGVITWATYDAIFQHDPKPEPAPPAELNL